jgi:peptide/nickel transport system ATP-binding protein
VQLLGLRERDMERVRGRRVSMLFQDPFTMLNPIQRSGRHIEEMLEDARGAPLPRAARRTEALRRLAEVGISDPDVADRFPFQLSGGMRQRVALAASLARDPDLLIADEPSTALDVTTQAEILALLKSVQDQRGMGLILITHDLRVAFSVCDRIHVLYAGSLVEVGPSQALESDALHPYTHGLLLSEPAVDRRLATMSTIEGSVPRPDEVAGQCPFAPRCAWTTDACRRGQPPLVTIEPGRLSACVRIAEIRPQLQAQRDTASRGATLEAAPCVEQALVVLRGVTKTFEVGRGRRVQAVRSASLVIGHNESVGLVGESGSGKTTLGRCLVGLETPGEGVLTIDGIDASSYERLGKADRRQVRRTVQMVFQDPYSSLDPTQRVGACLAEALGLYASAGDDVAGQVPGLLERVGLPAGYASRRPVALSGGERQRVAIARALAVGPRLLVCDEPVSSLDVSVQAQILRLFRALQVELGLSYLFITHDLAVVRQVVDRVYVMYRGEIVEAGPVDRVLDRPEHPYTRRLVASVPSVGHAAPGGSPRRGPRGER